MRPDGSLDVPDLNKATYLLYDLGFFPIDPAFIAEWEYDGDVTTRRVSSRHGKTNIVFKFAEVE